MGSLSDQYEVNLADMILGAGFTKPATVYMALFTTAPTDSALGTEVSTSGTGYARLSVTNNNTNFPGATTSGGVTTKTNGVDFIFTNSATSGWGTITHFAIMDLASAGNATNMILWGALGSSVTVSAGQLVKMPASSLAITCD